MRRGRPPARPCACLPVTATRPSVGFLFYCVCVGVLYRTSSWQLECRDSLSGDSLSGNSLSVDSLSVNSLSGDSHASLKDINQLSSILSTFMERFG